MKYILITSISLMVAAGFFGATDMTRDLRNGNLIDYENMEARHAKAILFIIKTTGLGTHRYIGLDKDALETGVRKEQEVKAEGKSQVIEYFEEFSRGDCRRC